MNKTLLTILGIATAGILAGGCASRNFVKNHDPVTTSGSYNDKNQFKMSFLNYDGLSYAVKGPNTTYMNDSTLTEEDSYIQATLRDNLELQEEKDNSFNWDPEKTITFKPTNEKVYIGDAEISRKVRKNKTNLTEKDYDTDIDDLFEEKNPTQIGNKFYLHKKIGNKLYLFEVIPNKEYQKFKKRTELGSLKIYLQANEGENSIYVADISSFKDRTKPTRSASALERATQSQPRVRVINSGETLSKIAKEYNVTVDYLVKLNGLKDANKISVGQHIRVK